MSLPMLMGSYSTKHLLKIITGVVLVIGDPWVDRIESRCARRRAGGALRRQLACGANSHGRSASLFHLLGRCRGTSA